MKKMGMNEDFSASTPRYDSPHVRTICHTVIRATRYEPLCRDTSDRRQGKRRLPEEGSNRIDKSNTVKKIIILRRLYNTFFGG